MENKQNQRDYVQTELPRLTASSVNDLNCPYRYHQLRVLKNWPKRDEFLNQAHGEATHEVLRELVNRQRDGELDLSKIELHARTAVYRARYPKDVDRNEAIAKVVDAVRSFVEADSLEAIKSTVANEKFIEIPMAHQGKPIYLLSTKLDRVVIESEARRVRVIDYKVSANRGTDLKAALIMLWAAKLAYPNFAAYVIEYIYLDEDGQIDRVEVHDHELKGIYKLVTDQAREVLTAKEFPLKQGDWCTFCPLRSNCPLFVAASAEDDPDLF